MSERMTNDSSQPKFSVIEGNAIRKPQEEETKTVEPVKLELVTDKNKAALQRRDTLLNIYREDIDGLDSHDRGGFINHLKNVAKNDADKVVRETTALFLKEIGESDED